MQTIINKDELTQILKRKMIIDNAICIYITKGKLAVQEYIRTKNIKFETIYKIMYS